MSANQMVNEAVSGYLSLRTAAVETDLADMLRKVRAYRQADPGFESAIAKVAEAEARLANQDPVEGEAITTGPTQGRARDLVRG